MPLPFAVAADHVTVTDWSPLVAETAPGAPGTDAGTTDADGIDGLPVPTEFVAVTVNV
jgi:hypothetical protein